MTNPDPLWQLCERLDQYLNKDYPELRQGIIIASLVTKDATYSKVIKHLDTLMQQINLAVGEYCSTIGHPWCWPFPTPRNQPTPEDVL